MTALVDNIRIPKGVGEPQIINQERTPPLARMTAGDPIDSGAHIR